MERRSLLVNQREYAWPEAPVVVVCIDGSEPDYMDRAIADGRMPWLAKTRPAGTDRVIACCADLHKPEQSLHCDGPTAVGARYRGQFFWNPDTGEEAMMNDPAFLRCGTILAAFAEAGARVAVVTAKDKPRLQLGYGMRFGAGNGICFSSEKADQVTLEENGVENVLDLVGMPVPDV